MNFESVHVCPNCGLGINLADLDLRTITTGVVDCHRCGWSGRIEISIVETDEPTPVSKSDG